MSSNFEKFKLLMWKNWKLQYRHPLQTAVEILAPILFSVLLVVIRSLVQPEKHNAKIYPAFDPIDAQLNMTQLVYSPYNIHLDDVMIHTIRMLGIPFLVSFKNAHTMEFALKDNIAPISILAGVQFDDELLGDVSIPNHLHIALRFPGELRIRKRHLKIVVETWHTNLLFPFYQHTGPRDYENEETASPCYYREQFLGLQLAITNALIQNFGGKPAKIIMQRFPYPHWIVDPLLLALGRFAGMIILLSFIYTAISTVKIITIEKEKQLKEAMKIMGLSSWLHWTVWFVKTFIFLFISVLFMVILLKIPWYPGTSFSVLTFADPLVVIVLLIFYICGTITYCFMISTFFSRANTAAAIAGLIWFVMYAPYLFLQKNYNFLSLGTKLSSSLFLNSAMAYGFQIIIMYEGSGEGIQWYNIWMPISSDDNLAIGHIMLMLILDSVVYLLIALYVEAIFPGDYGVPLVWYFPFSPEFWKKNEKSKMNEVEILHPGVSSENDIFENEPTNLQPGIQIRHLHKSFKKRVAVKDLSLNMYQNQITVLLGHNGAGKTTTICMLIGMCPPSGGTASIGGYNILTSMEKVRETLGFCPQHNILFDELTVREHLFFFSKLKGLPHAKIAEETNKYIEMLELVPKRNEKSEHLSGGMKRKLCIGIALCGNSKIVVLDEPSSGMDPCARRSLWDLLQTQKIGRTILLTTHFMDEADLLGDRIAIMAGGQLQCCGSSFFLKSKFGAGYNLIIEKTAECDSAAVTALLRENIPNLVVESNIGSQLTYSLNKDHSDRFKTLLNSLDDNANRLGIISYAISLSNLEEVFIKVCANYEKSETVTEPEGKISEDLKLQLEVMHASEVKFAAASTVSGMALRRNQILAMLLKKMLSVYRTWLLLLIQVLLPVIFLIIAMIMSSMGPSDEESPELDLSLKPYENPVTVMSGSNIYKSSYKQMLKSDHSSYIDWQTKDVSQMILQKTQEDVGAVRNNYIIGCTFNDDNSMIAWFNNQPYHSPAQSLAVALRAVTLEELGSKYTINVTNFPFPLSVDTKFNQVTRGKTMGFDLAFNIGLGMAFVSSFYVLFYIKERVIKAKHLQFVSGVNVHIFWFTSFLCDLVTFVFTTVCVIVTLVVFQEDGFNTLSDTGRLFLLLLFFGYSMLPLQYLASFYFKQSSTGFVKMSLFSIITGPAAFLTVQVLNTKGLDLEYVGEVLDWIFLVLPHYCLCSGIMEIYTTYSVYNLCSSISEKCVSVLSLPEKMCWNLTCERESICCDVKIDYFKWAPHGVGRNIFFFLVTGTIFLLLLFITESNVFLKFIYRLKSPPFIPPENNYSVDSDVIAEKNKIRNATQQDLNQYNLVLKDITKYYKTFFAVNTICLGIKRFECFGLLGSNGAGKTSLFRMMTGDAPISYGDVWINGVNLKKNIKEVHKVIGYCPQFDALFDHLTGNEHMIMFCLLRGNTFFESKKVADSLARTFDFHQHLHKQVQEYSGGNKRKLSTAISVIGDPPVIFLDEPTTGMDPSAKRHLWNALCRIRENGKCLVLTSHSMEECEALCTKLAIMVNGNFKCLGSPQHLKNKFSGGHTLTVKLLKPPETGGSDSLQMAAIEEFVKTNFPSAILKERHEERLTYFIDSDQHSLGEMFGILETGKKVLPIEDYSIAQSSLEQVFLIFTRKEDSDITLHM